MPERPAAQLECAALPLTPKVTEGAVKSAFECFSACRPCAARADTCRDATNSAAFLGLACTGVRLGESRPDRVSRWPRRLGPKMAAPYLRVSTDRESVENPVEGPGEHRGPSRIGDRDEIQRQGALSSTATNAASEAVNPRS